MSTSTYNLSRQLLVGELIKRAAFRAPNKEAFVFGETRYTFKKTEERATHLAGWLQEKGMTKDDKVGFLLKNGLPFFEIFFGIALSGAVGTPINFRLAAGESEVIEYVGNHIASYKKPKEVEFIAELPHNASGKILKRLLREREIKRRSYR